ncbi:MAG: hypothetical protein JW943_10470 [Deltaproteobacteria bacterium]|nr:hypothetical protein [Deltaproteobacteria bacterium]
MMKKSRASYNSIPVMVRIDDGYPKFVRARIHLEGSNDDHIEITLPNSFGTFHVGDAGRERLDGIFGAGRVECVEILNE